ncbi:MAG: Gfo/Idh/MocA family oxidoreductase [Clostridia bacterium]|nr:Gfo/Idh/MocA family oxidoreductase [Clostridia bacterium]
MALNFNVSAKNTKKVKVGIIGCGKIAQLRHAPEYDENQNAEIVGVYDFDQQRCIQIAMAIGCKAYTSVDELLSDSEIEAVSICSPNFTHAEYSMKALEAGKHVLCEKPMALDPADSRKMMEKAEEKGKILMIGHNQRLNPTHKRAKEVLESGAIGDIISFQSNFKHSGPETWSITNNNTTWFFDKTKAQFGAMGDLGAHKIDIIRFLLGHEIEEVNSYIMTLDKRGPDGNLIGVDDNAMVFFKMDNGVPGIMHVAWTNYGGEDNSTIIYGTKGVMKIFGDYADDIVLEMRDHTTVKYTVSRMQTNDNQTSSGIIDEFISSILENRTPLITGQDGHNTLAAIAACFKSSEEKTWVKVEY